MNCSVVNLSPLPRSHWGVLTVPRRRAKDLPAECTFQTVDGRQWRAVRGRSVGLKTVFRIHAHLEGNQRVDGQLLPHAHADATNKEAQAHKWVVDDVLEMIPRVGVPLIPGNFASIAWSDIVDLQVVSTSPAHTRFQLHQRLPMAGLHFSCWIDVLHNDPVATFRGRIVWSDRNDQANLKTFEHLVWKCGEYCSFDYARRYGISDPVGMGTDWVALLNAAPVTFCDGMALPVSGRILSFDSTAHPLGDPSDITDVDNLAFQNLCAAAFGPVLGVCHEWEHDWLAAGHLPRFQDAWRPRQQADTDWFNWTNQMQNQGGYFADRLFALSRMPGQTGNQPDFGATKGSSVVVAHDARLIWALQQGADGEALRGYTHFDQDGHVLQAEAHPAWVTWSRRTHWSTGVSTDRLGKSPQLPFPQGGYEGVDDEHCSQNYLAAHLALTDDPLHEDQLRFLLQTDRAAYRFRYPNNGSGPTRAQGRTAGSWAQLACVAADTDAAGFVDLLARRMLQSGTIDTMHVAGPMKTPCVQGPDPRKTIYGVDGLLARYTCVWEIGLYCIGFAQVVLRDRGNRSDVGQRALDLLLVCAETLAQFGFFQQGGQWFTVWDILWNGGEPPPGGMVNPSPHITSNPGAGDVGSWTFAGCVAAREFLPRENPHWARLNEYVLAITGGQEAGNRETAEWWAIAAAIAPTP